MSGADRVVAALHEYHQAIRISERKGTQEQGIDERGDCRRTTDCEPEGEDACDSKAAIAAESPQRVARILREALEPRSGPRVLHAFTDDVEASSHLASCRHPRLVFRHASA